MYTTYCVPHHDREIVRFAHLSVSQSLYLATVFLRLFVIADADEKQVAFVVAEGLTVIFVFYLLQCAFCAFVVFQFDYHCGDVRQIRYQDQVCVALARRQLLDKRVAGVGVEVRQTDCALKAVLVVVGQRVSHLCVSRVEGFSHRLLIAFDGCVEEFFGGFDEFHNRSVIFFIVDRIYPLLAHLLVRYAASLLLSIVRKVTQMYQISESVVLICNGLKCVLKLLHVHWNTFSGNHLDDVLLDAIEVHHDVILQSLERAGS